MLILIEVLPGKRPNHLSCTYFGEIFVLSLDFCLYSNIKQSKIDTEASAQIFHKPYNYFPPWNKNTEYYSLKLFVFLNTFYVDFMRFRKVFKIYEVINKVDLFRYIFCDIQCVFHI